MLQEPSKELRAGESHRSLLVVIRIILPTESDFRFGDGDNPMVGNSNAMGIASQVLQDMVWPAKGWFRIHDPILPKQGAQESAEVGLVRQRYTLSEESELLGVESAPQASAELAAEDAAEHLHRQEEIGSRRDPARVVWRKATTRHDTMDVRVLLESLSPSVQDGEESNLGTQMLRIGRDFP